MRNNIDRLKYQAQFSYSKPNGDTMAGASATAGRQRSTETVTLQDFICDVAMVLSNQGALLCDTSNSTKMLQIWLAVVNGEDFKENPGRPAALDKIRFDYYNEYPQSGRVREALTTISAFFATHISSATESRWFIATGVHSRRWQEFQERDEDYKSFVNAAAHVAERYIGDGRLMDFLPEGLVPRS